jgi:hypothetical protein
MTPSSVLRKLEQLVCDEFELMESCQEAAQDSNGEERARLLHQAGRCQVHMFQLESSLIVLGRRFTDYSTCVRRSLRSLGRPTWQGILDRLTAHYQRILALRLPPTLSELLDSNLDEHQCLAAALTA